ncbi:hypothetical protein LOK49_LG03G00965 [Camellia lanceoleosa]|uniref:Uncharacterized protein n=1 Tax=Camellia lanceoleosa TaxID=1840588 RepID=A0ACC0IJ79_9ERIC|nr:hypothetical protein LOK49_LG03G00965 [Camellia lanceoleosa]
MLRSRMLMKRHTHRVWPTSRRNTNFKSGRHATGASP